MIIASGPKWLLPRIHMTSLILFKISTYSWKLGMLTKIKLKANYRINMNAPRNRWPSLHTTFWLSQQRLIIEVSLLSFSNEAEKSRIHNK